MSLSSINEQTDFPVCVLEQNFWNDKGFVTGYRLYFISNLDQFLSDDKFKEIGLTKIGQSGMKHDNSVAYLKNEVSPRLPEEKFSKLHMTIFL